MSPGRLAIALAALVLALAGAPAARADAATARVDALDDAGYLGYMDRMERRLDVLWDDRLGRYAPGGSGVDTTFNANMLLVHAVAAQAGHAGAARRDARVARIVDALLAAPPYVVRPYPSTPDSQDHVPGWSSSMWGFSKQHVMIDAEVVDGLVAAWRARDALQLAPAQAARIAAAVHAVARGPFWRWPSIRLNQINWYATLYAADATVTGDPTLLRDDLRRQIHRFASSRASATAAGNFGPGMRFHYIPQRPASDSHNVDTAEYASIVAGFARQYGQARRAGMRVPSAADRRRLGAWLERVLAGYWTHAGYLNWDSGLGFHRWHQAKKLGLAQQGLIGIASAPSLLRDRRDAAYAKWLLDRGLGFYERQADRAGGLAPGLFFGVHVIPQGIASARLAASREAANAARALAAGLGRAPSTAPPPLYAYDPDIGRLAVTTPAYNTAIVAVNQGAFPYGGLELARLYDGGQEVAANIGGRPPSAFGLLVRTRSGRRVLATQVGRRRVDRRVTPLRLTRAPAGTSATAAAPADRAYAGRFSDLRAAGTVRRRGVRVRVQHRFTARWIQTRWTLRRDDRDARDARARPARRGRAPYRVDALFPSWGAHAQLEAVRRDRSTVAVGGRLVPLRDVDYLYVRSERSGYVVVPRDPPAHAAVHALHTRPQGSDPRPGPTLAIQLAGRTRARRIGLAVRLAPVADAREAAVVAARLRGRR